MKKLNFIWMLLVGLTSLSACRESQEVAEEELRYEFPNILDITVTPDSTLTRVGCFSDAGSWMGFTLPEKEKWVNGFCGPFSIDNRIWFAQAIAEVGFADCTDVLLPDSVSYFPGEAFIKSSSASGIIEQRLCFVNAQTALLQVVSNGQHKLSFAARGLSGNVETLTGDHSVTLKHKNGEIVQLLFQPGIVVGKQSGGYWAESSECVDTVYVAISFYASEHELFSGEQRTVAVLSEPEHEMAKNAERWQGYLTHVLRNDMKYEYDRIAVKAVVTLMSNWRTHREGLLHEGIIPSHAVGYFIGFWAWDSWRFSAALARFAPELAKNNIRAMFDYQQPDGMIIDCIYTDPAENNARDSKPPLVCWAVDEIFTHHADTAFVREMYPQLLAYYKWWYQKRDHDRNGMCEFGSTDGTVEAAAWESGMDNAIRFDNAKMVQNAPDAWSFDQESVDLNAYLALECRLLKKFAGLIGCTFDGPDYSEQVASYFFNEKTGFFGDRKLADRSFVEDLGCEGYTPFWTGIATQDQMSKALKVLTDPEKFSTYIPFPTAAADNPKCDPNGYWRGPIWLDQTYFAIKGLRNYGYNELADEYTLQVFDRLEGLKQGAPIHENYATHTGKRLKAPHFSWSSSHLLMLYEEYGK